MTPTEVEASTDSKNPSNNWIHPPGLGNKVHCLQSPCKSPRPERGHAIAIIVEAIQPNGAPCHQRRPVFGALPLLLPEDRAQDPHQGLPRQQVAFKAVNSADGALPPYAAMVS